MGHFTHKCLASLLLLPLFFACGESFAQDYLVGEGDVLEITVYDHPDLTTVARVGGEGSIVFPLIGTVSVTGLTLPEVTRRIAALLSNGYIVEPQVSIFIRDFRSKKVIIMGQVNKPGLYVLHGNTTFLELLSEAGGLAKNAGDKAIIKRNASSPENGEDTLTIDLKELIRMGNVSEDTVMMDGDSIFVVESGMFYITGEVKKPDAYKYEPGTTVIKAVTTAGGFTDKASTRRIRIIRQVEGKEALLEKVMLDEPVKADDVIVVPESFF